MNTAIQGDSPEPRFRHLDALPRLQTQESVKGAARVLELKGRKGINPASIHSRVELAGGHTFNGSQGTMVLWFFALEDLGASFVADHMKMDDAFFETYPLLSDFETQRDVEQANFSFEWNRSNEFRAKFFKGTVYPSLKGFDPPQKAWVQAVPFNYFKKYQWYQLAVTWNDAAKSASLFVNGVLVGMSDRFNKDFHRDRCGDVLYTGCPALCHGEIQFYTSALDGGALYRKYRAYAPDYDPSTERQLRHVFEGKEIPDFHFEPGPSWTKQMDIDFQRPVEQINEFYVQGQTDSVRPQGSKEGLLIETPAVRYGSREAFAKQVYIWTNRTFEGDIYVEFEWKALNPNGLSLLMVHASGMTREDFMADYPRKTSGTMQTVYQENVRNYHWEFYREMNDVRNDVGTAFARKNPFAYRIGFGSAPKPFATGEWHKLQLLQRDGRMRGAIDGKLLLDFEDNSWTNSGGILNYGHIAIRCMVHTKMLFRNLKVYTDRLPFAEVKTWQA